MQTEFKTDFFDQLYMINLLFLFLFLQSPEDDDDLDADIKSEAEQTREQQEATLRRRIAMVKSSIESLTKASLTCK